MSNPVSSVKSVKVWLKTNGFCWYCGKKLLLELHKRDMFIIEHQNNRSNEIENLVPSCRHCNRLKKQMTVEEYRMKHQKKTLFYGEKL